MIKRLFSLFLVTALMSGACFGQSKSPPSGSIQERIRAFPPQSPIEIRLLDGSKLRGWIGEISATEFVLTQERDRLLEKRSIPFQQVRAAKQVGSVKPSHIARNILIVVGITAALAVVTLAAVVPRIGG